MVDVIEAPFNIRVKHILALISYTIEDCCDSIGGTASRSEPIAVGFKQGFPLGFEGLFGYCLTCPIDHHGYAERPLLRLSWLGYPDTPERLRFPLAHPFRVNGFGQGQSSDRRDGFDKRKPKPLRDRKSTRLNSSHTVISYAVFCL